MVSATKIYLAAKRLFFAINVISMSISNAMISRLLNIKNLEKEPNDVPWFGKLCIIDMFPFGSLLNEESLERNDFDFPSFADSTHSFEITSNLMNLPNLVDYDIDEHMPQNIDSRYFTLPELSS